MSNTARDYTLFHGDGRVMARGVTVTEAAETILCHDGGDYALARRPDLDVGTEVAWVLMVRSTRRDQWSPAAIGTAWVGYDADEDAAWRILAGYVCAAAWGARAPYALTGAAADAAVAEYERDVRLDREHERREAAILRRATL